MVPTPEQPVTPSPPDDAPARPRAAPAAPPPGAGAPPPGAFVPRPLRAPPEPGDDPGPRPEVPALHFPAFHFPAFPPPHAFTGRAPPDPAGADPPLGDRDREAADRLLLRRLLGAKRLHAMRQVHGATVVVAGSPNDAPHRPGDRGGDAAPTCDALITARPGEAAAVKTADCIPLLLHDERTGAAAAVHAGWRGAAARVVDRAVAAFAETTGSPPTSFHAAIGPAIGPCCFEVGPEVLTAFAAAGRNPDDIRRPPPPRSRSSRPPRSSRSSRSAYPPRPHLDLPLDTRLRLLAAGLAESRIHQAARCTRCDPAFHSHRRSAPHAGRNWSVVLTTPA